MNSKMKEYVKECGNFLMFSWECFFVDVWKDKRKTLFGKFVFTLLSTFLILAMIVPTIVFLSIEILGKAGAYLVRRSIYKD